MAHIRERCFREKITVDEVAKVSDRVMNGHASPRLRSRSGPATNALAMRLVKPLVYRA